MNIATTILAQIGTKIGQTLTCIGGNGYYALPADDKAGVLGGVAFKTGRNPKMNYAKVFVKLMANDTYTVIITTSRGREVLNVSDCHAEDLGGPYGIIEGTLG